MRGAIRYAELSAPFLCIHTGDLIHHQWYIPFQLIKGHIWGCHGHNVWARVIAVKVKCDSYEKISRPVIDAINNERNCAKIVRIFPPFPFNTLAKSISCELLLRETRIDPIPSSCRTQLWSWREREKHERECAELTVPKRLTVIFVIRRKMRKISWLLAITATHREGI